MNGRMLTPRQREVLQRRVARALLWATTTAYAKDEANRLARAVIEDIEDAGFTAGTQRRAVEAIVAKLEAVS